MVPNNIEDLTNSLKQSIIFSKRPEEEDVRQRADCYTDTFFENQYNKNQEWIKLKNKDDIAILSYDNVIKKDKLFITRFKIFVERDSMSLKPVKNKLFLLIDDPLLTDPEQKNRLQLMLNWCTAIAFKKRSNRNGCTQELQDMIAHNIFELEQEIIRSLCPENGCKAGISVKKQKIAGHRYTPY